MSYYWDFDELLEFFRALAILVSNLVILFRNVAFFARNKAFLSCNPLSAYSSLSIRWRI